jgi:two-component system, OmpR family, sensor histidine kinase MprB
MTLRARIALVSAAAVAVALVGAGVAGYALVRSELLEQVDASLANQAQRALSGPGGRRLGGRGAPFLLPAPVLGGPGGFGQLVDTEGAVIAPAGVSERLPVSDTTLAVARGGEGPTLADARVDGVHVRILTVPVEQGLALQIARPLQEVDATLSRLRMIGAVSALVGVALAAVLGVLVARTTTSPLRRLTQTAEAIAVTGDPAQRVGLEGDDELGRLGASFDTMLGALEESQSAQRRLVGDASHELRTPLTSLRVNLELLGRHDLTPPERAHALDQAVLQVDELTALVADVVELARDGEAPLEVEDVRLDELVDAAVERARRHADGIRFDTSLEPVVITGAPARLDRAIANLLDNAAEWSPPDGVVAVTVDGPKLVVRDHGPGIGADDLPRIFDRFYRAPAARAKPGSGLGLAIVRRVADEHGARITVENAPDGGARFILRFGADPG